MKRTTILDLRDSPWVDGPGRTILDCGSSLRGRGYDLVIGAFSGGAYPKSHAYAEEAARRGLAVRMLQEKRSLDFGVVRQVTAIIDEVGADIVHTHDFRSNIFGLLAARLRRKPVVTTVHGWIANDSKGKFYVATDKAIIRFFDHIVTVSERTRTLVEKTRVNANKVSVIPNALILDRYVPERRDDAFRREIRAGRETLLIANIGRLSPEKGQIEFLQAAKRLLEMGIDAKFILIGIGPDQEKLGRYVAENGMTSAVVFAGFRDDMIRIYNSLDLVVQSSYTEGMPNVVLEALLMEVAVIATDVGGTAEVLRHAQTGMLIRPGVVEEIVDQISAYRSEPEKFRAMARQGRQDISRRYDHNLRVDRLAALYRRLQNQGQWRQ